MTKIPLRFREPLEEKGTAYYKPLDVGEGRGPSMWVNKTFIDNYFPPDLPMRVTLIIESEESSG